MRRVSISIGIALLTFAAGVAAFALHALDTDTGEWEEMLVPAVPAPNVLASDARDIYVFSTECYCWTIWDETARRYTPIVVIRVGENDPCEAVRLNEPGYFVPRKVAELCREWDGRGNVREWLRERGGRGSAHAPPNGPLKLTRR